MIGKHWSNRLLLSYLPVFILCLTVVVSASFLVMSDLTKSETTKSNKQFVNHVQQTLDSTLKSIDALVSREVLRDVVLIDYLSISPQSDPLLNYRVSNKLMDIVRNSNLIDSIYLASFEKRMVISPYNTSSLDESGMSELLQLITSGQQSNMFSYRTINRFEFGDQEREVITFVRDFPSFHKQGVLIVNVSVAALRTFVNETFSSELYSLQITDSNGHWVASNMHSKPGFQEDPVVLNQVKSNYTNWIIISGLTAKKSMSVLSALSFGWAIIVFVTVLAGILWIGYVTRKNYKPIENILKQIGAYSFVKAMPMRGKYDEFGYIQSTLESLKNTSEQFQRLHKEDVMFRKRHFFHEIMEGNRQISIQEWQQELSNLNVPNAFHETIVMIMEIDHFAAFCTDHSSRDQFLFKYILANVLQEITSHPQRHTWSEWMTNHRLGILVQFEDSEEDKEAWAYECCRKFQQWIGQNLDFTVSIALGSKKDEITDVSNSYSEALTALTYKAALGLNQIITQYDIPGDAASETHSFKQQMKGVVESVLLMEAAWEEKLQQVMSEIRTALCSRDQTQVFVRDMVELLIEGLEERAPEAVISQSREGVSKMREALEAFEHIDELTAVLVEELREISYHLQALRETRNPRITIREVRKYIDEHYADKDLSLNQLSDTFGLSDKYISLLFKQEFNENFADYLANIRIEQAKRLLRGSSDPIQQIASSVGYESYVSFSRVFKKLTLTTPGEYRKNG
jgi:two-component system response regulator YesN